MLYKVTKKISFFIFYSSFLTTYPSSFTWLHSSFFTTYLSSFTWLHSSFFILHSLHSLKEEDYSTQEQQPDIIALSNHTTIIDIDP